MEYPKVYDDFLNILRPGHAGILFKKSNDIGINYGSIRVIKDNDDYYFIYMNYKGMVFLIDIENDVKIRNILYEKINRVANDITSPILRDSLIDKDIQWLLNSGYVDKIRLDEIERIAF
jgi:hypothetical protein